MHLTRQQKRIIDYIQNVREQEGVAPSYSEIAKFLDIHKGAVQWHLQSLFDKGIIRRDKGKHRSLEIVEASLNSSSQLTRTLPLLGSIIAGLPEEEQEDRSELDPIDFLTGGKNCFLLRVRGESMIEAHIQEGDLVAVDPNRAAHNGDIVVALVDGDSTLKYFRKKGSTMYLEAANASMPKQILGNEGQIQGVVISLLRQM